MPSTELHSSGILSTLLDGDEVDDTGASTLVSVFCTVCGVAGQVSIIPRLPVGGIKNLLRLNIGTVSLGTTLGWVWNFSTVDTDGGLAVEIFASGISGVSLVLTVDLVG